MASQRPRNMPCWWVLLLAAHEVPLNTTAASCISPMLGKRSLHAARQCRCMPVVQQHMAAPNLLQLQQPSRRQASRPAAAVQQPRQWCSKKRSWTPQTLCFLGSNHKLRSSLQGEHHTTPVTVTPRSFCSAVLLPCCSQSTPFPK